MRGCKTFSATMSKDRAALGDVVTAWLNEHPEYAVVERTVLQSSDSEFHCLSITLWYETEPRDRSTT